MIQMLTRVQSLYLVQKRALFLMMKNQPKHQSIEQGVDLKINPSLFVIVVDHVQALQKNLNHHILVHLQHLIKRHQPLGLLPLYHHVMVSHVYHKKLHQPNLLIHQNLNHGFHQTIELLCEPQP